MVRRVVLSVALLAAAGLVLAGETKELTGTVKSTTGGTFVVTDQGGQDWTFGVDSKETVVVKKGARHKMDALKASGQPTVIGEFLSPDEKVLVKYTEKEGKLTAQEVHVKQ
jgi:hypothetical protein